jgi:adenosyl cobinamide kinase/adenosyl cobinamide phosphate guanylyltransferase
MEEMEEEMSVESEVMLESIQVWIEQLLEQSDTSEKKSEYNKILDSLKKIRG